MLAPTLDLILYRKEINKSFDIALKTDMPKLNQAIEKQDKSDIDKRFTEELEVRLKLKEEDRRASYYYYNKRPFKDDDWLNELFNSFDNGFKGS